MKRGRDQFKKFKPLINFLIGIMRIFPHNFRKKMFELFRMKKGKSGLLIRYILLKSLAEKVGDNVFIAPGSYLLNVEYLRIGNNVSIHPMCYIEARGGIEIGDNVSIAHGVTIMSETHIYDRVDIPIKDQGMYYENTIIDSDVWIGAKATILCGIKIYRGSIVAAGAVVTKNVDSYSIVAGVPARLIKKRQI